ncbi:hypothetical protein [Winogradskyella sediminis]|uniref:hypothetical protein n=1 Tax=Winogradskyella sediminis TaxID=1382466 RepID=UPI003AA8B93F
MSIRKYLYVFFLIPLLAISQEKKSFHLKDIIYLKANEGEKVDSFLKSRYFDYVGIDSQSNSHAYALNYDNSNGEATTWCYKYLDGRVKVLESDGGKLIMFIKEELNTFKSNFEYQTDGWVMTSYFYKQYAIGIRENDVLDKYELYIENQL